MPEGANVEIAKHCNDHGEHGIHPAHEVRTNARRSARRCCWRSSRSRPHGVATSRLGGTVAPRNDTQRRRSTGVRTGSGGDAGGSGTPVQHECAELVAPRTTSGDDQGCQYLPAQVHRQLRGRLRRVARTRSVERPERSTGADVHAGVHQSARRTRQTNLIGSLRGRSRKERRRERPERGSFASPSSWRWCCS